MVPIALNPPWHATPTSLENPDYKQVQLISSVHFTFMKIVKCAPLCGHICSVNIYILAFNVMEKPYCTSTESCTETDI